MRSVCATFSTPPPPPHFPSDAPPLRHRLACWAPVCRLTPSCFACTEAPSRPRSPHQHAGRAARGPLFCPPPVVVAPHPKVLHWSPPWAWARTISITSPQSPLQTLLLPFIAVFLSPYRMTVSFDLRVCFEQPTPRPTQPPLSPNRHDSVGVLVTAVFKHSLRALIRCNSLHTAYNLLSGDTDVMGRPPPSLLTPPSPGRWMPPSKWGGPLPLPPPPKGREGRWAVCAHLLLILSAEPTTLASITFDRPACFWIRECAAFLHVCLPYLHPYASAATLFCITPSPHHRELAKLAAAP